MGAVLPLSGREVYAHCPERLVIEFGVAYRADAVDPVVWGDNDEVGVLPRVMFEGFSPSYTGRSPVSQTFWQCFTFGNRLTDRSE